MHTYATSRAAPNPAAVLLRRCATWYRHAELWMCWPHCRDGGRPSSPKSNAGGSCCPLLQGKLSPQGWHFRRRCRRAAAGSGGFEAGAFSGAMRDPGWTGRTFRRSLLPAGRGRSATRALPGAPRSRAHPQPADAAPPRCVRQGRPSRASSTGATSRCPNTLMGDAAQRSHQVRKGEGDEAARRVGREMPLGGFAAQLRLPRRSSGKRQQYQPVSSFSRLKVRPLVPQPSLYVSMAALSARRGTSTGAHGPIRG